MDQFIQYSINVPTPRIALSVCWPLIKYPSFQLLQIAIQLNINKSIILTHIYSKFSLEGLGFAQLDPQNFPHSLVSRSKTQYLRMLGMDFPNPALSWWITETIQIHPILPSWQMTSVVTLACVWKLSRAGVEVPANTAFAARKRCSSDAPNSIFWRGSQ